MRSSRSVVNDDTINDDDDDDNLVVVVVVAVAVVVVVAIVAVVVAVDDDGDDDGLFAILVFAISIHNIMLFENSNNCCTSKIFTNPDKYKARYSKTNKSSENIY